MAKRVILIKHEQDPGDDRVSDWLAANGYQLDWRAPCLGDTLEEPGEDIAGAVIYGGPQNVCDRLPYIVDEARFAEKCMLRDIPLVGLCLGGQIVADALGAWVGPGRNGLHEFGYYKLSPTEAGRALFPDEMHVTEAHSHEFDIPAGAVHLASTEHYANQAFSFGDKTFGFQFHPEISGPGFIRWQNADWAYWDKPGAQTRTEQEAIAPICVPVQDAWMDTFLMDLFGPAAD